MLGGAAGLVVACFTFYQINLDLSDRREERIIRAWDHLLRKVPGNTGKAEVIEVLFSYGQSIDHLRLTCPEPLVKNNCPSRIVLEGLFRDWQPEVHELFRPGWQDTIQGKGVIAYADFSHAEFIDVNLSQWVLQSVIARNSVFSNGDFLMSSIDGDFEGSWFAAADFGGARLEVKAEDAAFPMSNFSGATIVVESLISSDTANKNSIPDFSASWFWADRPPSIRIGDDELSPSDAGFKFACDINGVGLDISESIAPDTPPYNWLIGATLDLGSGFREVSCGQPIAVEEAVERYPNSYSKEFGYCNIESEVFDAWGRAKKSLEEYEC